MSTKRERSSRGSVRVWRCERGVAYPTIEGHVNVPAWSRGSAPWKDLSPFTIGPIDGCRNFESWWQSFKVWKRVDAQQQYDGWKWPAETHVDPATGNPNAAWHRWHEALIKHPRAVRRPNGRAIPEYAWWKGERLGIIEARKQLYIPHLQALYRAHPTYQRLLKMVRDGTNVVIIEPDGPAGHPNGIEADDIAELERLQSAKTVSEAFPMLKNDNRYFPYGHGYVIALTIAQDTL